jgi:CubicO group peptidase (beta-lactamase class C family)
LSPLCPLSKSNLLSLLALVLSAATVAAQPAAEKDPRWLRLDAAVRRGMAEWEVPGLAIAVVEGDRVSFIRAYGVKELGKPQPVDLDTVMAIGSTTKAMTATLVAMLVDEGKLAWDDRVTKHLPWLQLFDPWVTREVTLRDLLTHRVGVGGALLPAATTLDRREVLRRLRFIEPYAPFRAQYDYSNLMYTTVGEVVADVSGKGWEDVLQSRLLAPLGITGAQLTLDSLWSPENVAPCFCCDLVGRSVGIADARPGTNVTMPHLKKNGRMQVIPWRRYANIGPAGGELSMSVRDMARWVRFLVGKGVFEGKRLLSEKQFAEMHEPQIPIPRENWSPFLREEPAVHFMAYGLGWRLNDYRGRRMSSHTGNVYGFHATVGLLPDDGIGVVVIANADRTGLAPALVLSAFDLHLGAPEVDWSRRVLTAYEAQERETQETEKRLTDGRRAGTSPQLPLSGFAGTYFDRAYGEVHVTAEPGGLVLRFPGAQEADLTHWHYDLFRMSLRGPMAYPRFARFVIGPDGKVARLSVEGVADFVRRSPETAVSATGR